MKQLCFFVLFLLATFWAIGQDCTRDIIELRNQLQVDTFIKRFPNCTEIDSDLFISRSDINNLKGLSHITSITGDLDIFNTTNLSTLEGLENILFIGGGLNFERNGVLSDISALQNLTSAGSYLRILENDQLISLSGLENVKSIESDLQISNNPNLRNLEGLAGLETIGGEIFIKSNTNLLSLYSLGKITSVQGNLHIEDNISLRDLSGFESIESVIGDLTLVYNDSLNNISDLKNLVTIGGDLIIGDWQLRWPMHLYELRSLSGLDNLISVGGDLIINSIEFIENVDALMNLRTTGGDLIITRNNKLKNLSGLINLDSIGGSLEIKWNGFIEDMKGFEKISSIPGNLVIHLNDSLTNLSGLENVNFIGGNLELTTNPKLNNIESLEKLNKIPGDLLLGSQIVTTEGANHLNDFSGLENITSVDGNMTIRLNNHINNMKGFEGLTSIGGALRISSNSLENLEGLENLTFIGGDFTIDNNRELLELENLKRLQEIGGELEINFNKLSSCNIRSICNYLLDDNRQYAIHNNTFGCNSREEILAECIEISSVNYTIFYDQNQNGIQESNELIVPNIPIELEQTGEILVSGSTDVGRWFLDYGNYIVSFIDNPNWELTTPSEQNFEVSTNTPFVNISFGVFPKNVFSEKVTTIQSDRLRCGEKVPFKIIAKNLGTDFANGTLWLEIDPRLTDFTSNADIINGNTLGWNFQDLHPGHELVKEVSVQIPTLPTIPVGEILKFKSYFDNGENEFEYNAEMRCSYDPNDKLVTPDRSAEYQGTAYTKFDEDLFYTVRFQNTGNDVAYDVTIRDTLDTNLDPSTFKIISSSHYEVLNVSMEDERNLTFEFRDIYLPDSTTNFDASNGYVSYLIKTKDGLPEETPIQNTASIYFDSNPPVVTNTTENLMVTQLPTSSTDNQNQLLDIHVFPNPTDSKIYFSGLDLRDAVVTIYDLTGRLILVEKSGANEITLPETASGMLFLKVETEEGTVVKRVFKE